MAPALWHLVLVGALAAAASAGETGGSSAGPPAGLLDDDVCLGADEECSLSLRQLRHRQQQQEVAQAAGEEDVNRAAKLVDGAFARDEQLGSGDAEEGANIAEAALAGSTSSGHHHHHHHHHRAENQLRWAPDSKYCMSVDGNVFGNGQKMQLWQCKEGMGQYFDYTPTEPTTLLRSAAAPAFCVVVDGNHDRNGAKVQLWQCDPGAQAQRWIMQGHGERSVLLKNAAFPSKCLVVNSNGGYNGNKLQIWECEGAEHWKLWTPTR